MPIGAKMYEAAKDEPSAEDSTSKDASTDDAKKDEKDGPVEGEVVDEK